MTADLEAGGTHLADTGQAALYVVNLAARLAMEMMMVRQVGRFVTSRLAGHINRLDVAFFDQAFEGPVDRGNAQTGNIGLSFG